MNIIKWARSDEGYCDSKCLRFEIVPLFCGTTRAQYFDLYFTADIVLTHTRKRIASLCDTQRDCKAEAEDFMKREGITK